MAQEMIATGKRNPLPAVAPGGEAVKPAKPANRESSFTLLCRAGAVNSNHSEQPYQTKMKKLSVYLAAAACALAFATSQLAAAEAKTYQVTGPVLEIKDNYIVVQKGEDKWQVARNKETKITGDLKAGAKVTIEYQMIATDVEVKAEKAGPAKKK